MSTSLPFLQAKPLHDFIAHLAELPEWAWLYIAAGESEITLDTVCRPCAINSCDVSAEEIEEFEAHAKREGLRSFFCQAQLEDIVGNLRQQRPGFTRQQLADAVNYYWKHDAFIDLSTEAA